MNSIISCMFIQAMYLLSSSSVSEISRGEDRTEMDPCIHECVKKAQFPSAAIAAFLGALQNHR